MCFYHSLGVTGSGICLCLYYSVSSVIINRSTSICTLLYSPQGQYVFLHDAILEGYTSGDTEIVVGKLAKRMTELEALDDEGFRKEFEVSNALIGEREFEV